MFFCSARAVEGESGAARPRCLDRGRTLKRVRVPVLGCYAAAGGDVEAGGGAILGSCLIDYRGGRSS